jgi:hypothetical protein
VDVEVALYTARAIASASTASSHIVGVTAENGVTAADNGIMAGRLARVTAVKLQTFDGVVVK